MEVGRIFQARQISHDIGSLSKPETSKQYPTTRTKWNQIKSFICRHQQSSYNNI